MSKPEIYVVETSKSKLLLPIDIRKCTDPYYRYKMRQLCVQVVGKGKMIRTAFLNLDDIARDLQIPPDYLPNYFGKTMGATAKYDAHKPERERGSISGEYDVKELDKTLHRFIKSFVLCPKCEYPELLYNPVKKSVRIKCKSCGFKSDVHKMELDEKFRRYVLSNPPPKPKKITPSNQNGKSGRKKSGAAGNINTKMEKDSWGSDFSKEAIQKRMADMVPTNMQVFVDTEGVPVSVEGFAASLKQYAEAHSCDGEQLHIQLTHIAEQHKLSDDKIVRIFFTAFLSDVGTLYANVKNKYSDVLNKILNTKLENQVTFLECIEENVVKNPENDTVKKFLASVSGVFQFLQQEELVGDEAFLKWFNMKKDKGNVLRKPAKPFFDWLMKEDEESDEEDEEEEEEEEEKNKKDEEKKQKQNLDAEIDAL